MIKIIYKYLLKKMWINAFMHNNSNIAVLAKSILGKTVLDLGCDDGLRTLNNLQSVLLAGNRVFGVDIVHHALLKASERNIVSTQADASSALPFSSNSFDLIHSNQVIEHVSSVDTFMTEVFRITKTGGYVIISTENASSWVNVVAAALGYQMFSLTNMSSKRAGIGNPFAIHRNENIELSSWTHKTIFSLRGIREFSQAHGFEIVETKGAGYFPFSTNLAKMDSWHSHFITVLLRKI